MRESSESLFGGVSRFGLAGAPDQAAHKTQPLQVQVSGGCTTQPSKETVWGIIGV